MADGLAPPAPSSNSRSGRHAAVLALLAALGLLTFGGGLGVPFLYDDLHAIVDNSYIKGLDRFREDVGFGNLFNRSVLLFTFALNHEVGGTGVFGYHLVNVFLHICVAMVFYFLVQELLLLEPVERRAEFSRLPAVAAALHLLHPLTVEAVTYISSRSSVQATLCYLLAFYLFVRYWRNRRRWTGPAMPLIYLTAGLVMFYLGLATKEIVLTLPVMIGIYLLLGREAIPPRRLAAGAALLGLLVLAYMGYRYAVLGRVFVAPADPVSATMDRRFYFLTQIKVWTGYYLLKLLLPFNLNFEPDIRLLGPGDWSWIPHLMALAALAGALWIQPSRLLKFAGLWAAVTLLPTSSFVPLKQIAAEHRTYLPGLGICLALGWLWVRSFSVSRLGPVALALALVLFSALTLDRGAAYRSAITLWEDTAGKSPRKAAVHNNLAVAYLEENRLDRAVERLHRVLELDPESTTAHINLGNVFLRQNRPAEALEQFERAIEGGSERAEVFFDGGSVRLRLGRAGEAVEFLERAVQLKPHSAPFRFTLGDAYRKTGQPDRALMEYRKALQENPEFIEAHNNVGILFWEQKAYDLAEDSFNKALALKEDQPRVHENLAGMLMVQKQYGRAIPHLERLLELEPQNARARDLRNAARTLKDAPQP